MWSSTYFFFQTARSVWRAFLDLYRSSLASEESRIEWHSTLYQVLISTHIVLSSTAIEFKAIVFVVEHLKAL